MQQIDTSLKDVEYISDIQTKAALKYSSFILDHSIILSSPLKVEDAELDLILDRYGCLKAQIRIRR